MRLLSSQKLRMCSRRDGVCVPGAAQPLLDLQGCVLALVGGEAVKGAALDARLCTELCEQQDKQWSRICP